MKNNVLARLQSVASEVSKTVDVCLSSNKVREVNDALSEAKNKTAEALASVVNHPNKRSLSGTRKSLTAIDNLLAGLMHGLETRELKVKDFRAVCSNLKSNFIPKLETSFSDEVEKFKAEAGSVEEEVELTPEQLEIRNALLADQKILATGETDYERTERETNQVEEKRRNQFAGITGDVERRLARLRSEIDHIPKRLNTPYSIVKLPVAPHFETQSASNPTLLDKLAIPHMEIPLPGLGRDGAHGAARMERYVIFEQQAILLISKAYVEAILNKKTADIEDENSEQGREWRARRKELAKELAAAEEGIKKAEAKFKETPSQEDEIKRLREKIRAYSSEVEAALKGSYTAADRTMLEREEKLRGDIDAVLRKIDSRSELYRTGNEVKPNVPRDATDAQREDILRKHKEDLQLPYQHRYKRDMDKLQAELADLDKEYKIVSTAVEKFNRKYAKNAAVTKKIEQIGVMERKLAKARALETERKRIVPNAEEAVVRVTQEQARFEEDIKAQRKVNKRAGPPITTEDYARSVLSVINERSHSSYALVTPTPAPNPRISSNAQDILCFWIMPTTKLSALMRHTGGKAKVMRWDFPFESERFEKVAEQRAGWEHPSERGERLLAPLNGRSFKDLSETEQSEFFKKMSLEDQQDFLEFLEFSKNAKHRPKNWKSRYGAPIRKAREE